jgi:hypothetical protein
MKSPIPFLTDVLNEHYASKKWSEISNVTIIDLQKWIIASEICYQTISQPAFVSNWMDLTHHFHWNTQLIIIYCCIVLEFIFIHFI